MIRLAAIIAQLLVATNRHKHACAHQNSAVQRLGWALFTQHKLTPNNAQVIHRVFLAKQKYTHYLVYFDLKSPIYRVLKYRSGQDILLKPVTKTAK